MKKKFITNAVVLIMILVLSISLLVHGVSPTTEGNDNKQSQEIIKENEKFNDSDLNGIDDEYILSRQTAIALYHEGYDFYDIEVAKDLAVFCKKTPIELLKIKGKVQYIAIGENDEGNTNLVDSSKTWEEVTDELNIKLEKPTESLNIPAPQIEELKILGLEEHQIEVVFALAFNFNKDYKEIASEFKKGKTEKELEERFSDEKKKESEKNKVNPIQAMKNTEKLLIKQYAITNEDIEICKLNGITNIIDISFAKDVAIKNKISIKKVLELHNKHKQWDKVVEEAEVIGK